jgi:hypothetical protein
MERTRKQVPRMGRLQSPPPERVNVPAVLTSEHLALLKQARAIQSGMTNPYKTQRFAAPLQQLLLFNTPLSDLRHLYLVARAYLLQTHIADTFARTSRWAQLAPRIWESLATETETGTGRAEVRACIDKLATVPTPLNRASNATMGVLIDLNQRFFRLKGNDAWLHLGAVEGLLRYAESELARADKDSREAGRFLAKARIRSYEQRLTGRPLPRWREQVKWRFGIVVPEAESETGRGSVVAALAAQKGIAFTEAQRQMGTLESADGIMEARGYPENIATALRLLSLSP